MFQLGGTPLYLGADAIQLQRGETVADTARGAVALRGRHHGPRVRAPGRGGPGPARHGAGHQRALRPAASLPGAGRLSSRCWSGAGKLDGPEARLRRRRQQRVPRADAGRGQAGRRHVRGRARGLRAEPAHREERHPRRAEGGDAAAGGHRATPWRRSRAPTSSTPTSGRRWARRRRPRRGVRPSRASWSTPRDDGRGQPGRGVHALPARPSRRGGRGGGDRRPAVGGLRRGGEPPPRAEGAADAAAGREVRRAQRAGQRFARGHHAQRVADLGRLHVGADRPPRRSRVGSTNGTRPGAAFLSLRERGQDAASAARSDTRGRGPEPVDGGGDRVEGVLARAGRAAARSRRRPIRPQPTASPWVKRR